MGAGRRPSEGLDRTLQVPGTGRGPAPGRPCTGTHWAVWVTRLFLGLSFLPPLAPHLSSLRGKKLMTHFLTEQLLFLFAQTMVYTIHEIPIFIAMGVVGKGHPKDTNPPGLTLRHSRWRPPAEQSMWWGQGQL